MFCGPCVMIYPCDKKQQEMLFTFNFSDFKPSYLPSYEDGTDSVFRNVGI
jgi:hypothetical protein